MASIKRPELGFKLLHLFFHLPRDLAIAEVAFDADPQKRDVFRLRKFHFEQKTRARPKRHQIMRGGLRECRNGVERFGDQRFVLLPSSRRAQVPPESSKPNWAAVRLPELVASSMPV